VQAKIQGEERLYYIVAERDRKNRIGKKDRGLPVILS